MVEGKIWRIERQTISYAASSPIIEKIEKNLRFQHLHMDKNGPSLMSKNITHLHKGHRPDLAQQISRHQPKTSNLIYIPTLCKMLQ